MLPIQKREEKSEVALLDAEHGAPRKGSTAGDPLWIGAQGKASGASAFNNLTKAFLGAASFELPWALKQSGIGFGILSLIIFAWTCAFFLRAVTLEPAEPERGACLVVVRLLRAVVHVQLGLCDTPAPDLERFLQAAVRTPHARAGAAACARPVARP
jgi:hypothetical protein